MPRNRAAWHDVLDAAGALHLHRSALVVNWSGADSPPGTRLVAIEPDLEALHAETARWSQVLSVRCAMSASQLRESLPRNRERVGSGMRMVSAVDWDGATPAARAMLGREEVGEYFFVRAPVQMKIVNGDEVLMDGPFLGGRASIMAVRRPATLELALRYWRAVMATAVPTRRVAETPAPLTPRQREVVDLLAEDLSDPRIAATLGLSLRTVRYEVAEIKRRLGVGSRFAAGLAIGRGALACRKVQTPPEQDDDDPPSPE